MTPPVIQLSGVGKQYGTGPWALRDVSFQVEAGEFVAVVGRSGAGKSTLLRLINGLVSPTVGDVTVWGHRVTHLSSKELRALRSRIGMIFQEFQLVDRSTVLANVLAGRLGRLPAWRGALGLYRKEDYDIAAAALARVGLTELAHRRADRLSGGQRQRTAIARALAQQAELLLADEPVANVDPATARAIMGELKQLNRRDGITVLINLHAIDLAREYADRIIGLRDGRLVFDGPPAALTEAALTDIYGPAAGSAAPDGETAPSPNRGHALGTRDTPQAECSLGTGSPSSTLPARAASGGGGGS